MKWRRKEEQTPLPVEEPAQPDTGWATTSVPTGRC